MTAAKPAALAQSDGSNVFRFKCPYCAFRSRDLVGRTKHISAKHSLQLPFECSLCSYKCSSRTALLIHTRKHTGERPFHCPFRECKYSAASMSNLRRHIKIIHSTSS